MLPVNITITIQLHLLHLWMECYIPLFIFSIIIIVNGDFHSFAWGWWDSGVEPNPTTRSRTPKRNEWSVKYNPCIPLDCISTHILVMMKRYGPRHRNSFHTIPRPHICRNYMKHVSLCVQPELYFLCSCRPSMLLEKCGLHLNKKYPFNLHCRRASLVIWLNRTIFQNMPFRMETSTQPATYPSR